MQDRLSELSMDFAIRIVRLSQQLENSNEYVLSRQVRKSGTSVGANLREAKFAQSKADFVSKLQIALKEAAETDFWLELLYRTSYLEAEAYQALNELCRQIRALLIASIKTARFNSQINP